MGEGQNSEGSLSSLDWDHCSTLQLSTMVWPTGRQTWDRPQCEADKGCCEWEKGLPPSLRYPCPPPHTPWGLWGVSTALKALQWQPEAPWDPDLKGQRGHEGRWPHFLLPRLLLSSSSLSLAANRIILLLNYMLQWRLQILPFYFCHLRHKRWMILGVDQRLIPEVDIRIVEEL